jgi:hypothetical protein
MSNDAPNFDLEFKDAVSTTETKTESVQTEPEVPDKFKGKSVFDIIDMYQNAERKISEQGAELHAVRTQADELLGLRGDNAEKPKERATVTAEDLLTDPNLALDKVLNSSSVADKAEEAVNRVDALERTIGQREFEGRHPDFMKDVSNPEFQTWVGTNKARASLLVNLNKYNFEAGEALWDMWEERKQLDQGKSKADRKAVIRQASTVRSGPTESATKPVYSRVKLMELQAKAQKGDLTARAKWNDPAFQSEYQEAYREGRIK